MDKLRDPRPKAANHMLWFFILPAVLLIGWVGYRFLGTALKAERVDMFARIEQIRTGRSAGARWQAAFELSQELHRQLQSGQLSLMNPADKDRLFAGLRTLLDQHGEDLRLKRYLLLTLGKLKDARALPLLEKELDSKDAELRFFALWGLTEVLMSSPAENSHERLERLATLATDADAATRKVALSFLLQQPGGKYTALGQTALKDPDVEVRWNAAVALASMKVPSSAGVLKEIFDLQKLREREYKSPKDLSQVLGAAWDAARKLGDPTVLAVAQELKSKADPSTPEGHAILSALR